MTSNQQKTDFEMTKGDYFKLTTERVHNNLNFRNNQRFFLLYGKNANDEYLTQSFYPANLLQTLWATLKMNGFERVIFYNHADKFFFYDEESSTLARVKKENRQSVKPPVSSGSGRRQTGPLGAARNVLSRQTGAAAKSTATDTSASAGNSAATSPTARQNAVDDQGIIRMSPESFSGSGMSGKATVTYFNDFVTDDSLRTALVIADLENLSRIDDRVKPELSARFQQWGALKSGNRNALIFITSREPIDENSQHVLRRNTEEFPEVANLISIALGEKSGNTSGYISYIPSPFEAEVERWFTKTRIENRLPVEWSEFSKLVQWITAENKSIKELGGDLREYVTERADKNLSDEKINLMLARKKNWITGDSDPRPALERLENLIGLEKVKEQVKNLNFHLMSISKRLAADPHLNIEPPNLHLVFVGNPGTGKTTVARLIGEIYRDLGLLQRGHTVETRKDEIVGQYVGQTAPQTNAKINEALDGVFFLDEAYSLHEGGSNSGFGQDALNTIMTRMENERDRLAVILAGYEKEMDGLIAMNSGMSRRIGMKIHFDDYNADELMQIFEKRLTYEGFIISNETRLTMQRVFARMYDRRSDRDFFSFDENGKSTFGNAGEVRKLFQGMTIRQAVRTGGDSHNELTIADIPPEYEKFLPLAMAEDELSIILAELDGMVGLHTVKDFVRQLVNEAQLTRLGFSGLPKPTRHMVFTGNPGTGKTTVAQLIGRIYKALGILNKGHFKEVTRSDLVGEYIGHTEQKTHNAVLGAVDGVLLIDEAYSLARDPQDRFGIISIDTLVPMLEQYRDNLVVIFAGYTAEMGQFINSNPGLNSRIGYKIEFPDYESDEMLEILLRMAANDGFTVSDEARDELQKKLIRYHANRGDNFGNARDVRVQFYEKMQAEFKNRAFAELQAGRRPDEIRRSFTVSDLRGILIA